jgi:hypothetical protein
MAQTKNWRRSIVGVLAKLLRRMDAADLPGMDTASRAAGLTLSVAQTRLDHLLDLPGPTGQFQTTDVAEATDLLSRAICQAETATSYCPALVTKDFPSAHLKDKVYVSSFARLR